MERPAGAGRYQKLSRLRSSGPAHGVSDERDDGEDDSNKEQKLGRADGRAGEKFIAVLL